MTVSHHLLRRTARQREAEIESLKRRARSGDLQAHARLMEGHGIGVATRVKVESSMRGPFGWRVVTW